MTKQMIRIGIVDDHAVARAGLRQLLAEHADLQVVGEATNGREAVDLVRAVKIDVLILDVFMPGASGIDSLAIIRAKAPEVGILVLSGYPEEHYAMNLIRQGASGYLNKACAPREIIEALHAVARHRRYISSAVADILARQIDGKNLTAPHHQLSEREFQVLLRIAKGQTTGSAAADLSLSVKTISTHRTRIMEKLAVKSNSDLTYYALKNRLLD